MLAAAVGFAAGVIERGGWPALPPSDTFWWAVWAGPFGAVVAAGLASTPLYQAPTRAAWPQAPLALLMGYAITVRSSFVLGLLCALWGAALLGASCGQLGAPRTRAFGARTTSLLVLLGLLAAAWKYAAFPPGPLLLFVVALACVAVPLPERARTPACWVGMLLAVGATGWARATSQVLDLY